MQFASVDVVAIAKAAGFSITSEDHNSHSRELSDKELEDVAGAGHPKCSCPLLLTWPDQKSFVICS